MEGKELEAGGSPVVRVLLVPGLCLDYYRVSHLLQPYRLEIYSRQFVAQTGKILRIFPKIYPGQDAGARRAGGRS